MSGETPPIFSTADYDALAQYYSLFGRWQEAKDPDIRQDLQTEMADLDLAVDPVAREAAEDDVFAEAYVVGHALTGTLAGLPWGSPADRAALATQAEDDARREASATFQARVFALLEEAAREIIPVGDDRGFDPGVLSFLPQFAPAHVASVTHRVRGIRDKVEGVDYIDLSTALILTVTYHAPDLLQGEGRRRLGQLTNEWQESDEGQATIAEVTDNENKIRTNGSHQSLQTRRTVVTTRMPRHKTKDN